VGRQALIKGAPLRAEVTPLAVARSYEGLTLFSIASYRWISRRARSLTGMSIILPSTENEPRP